MNSAAGRSTAQDALALLGRCNHPICLIACFAPSEASTRLHASHLFHSSGRGGIPPKHTKLHKHIMRPADGSINVASRCKP